MSDEPMPKVDDADDRPRLTLTFPKGIETNFEYCAAWINAVVHVAGGRPEGYSVGGGWVSKMGEVMPYKGLEGVGGKASDDLILLAEALGEDGGDQAALMALLDEIAALVPRRVAPPPPGAGRPGRPHVS